MKKHFFQIILFVITFFTFSGTKAANIFGNDTAFIRTYGGVNFEEFRDIVQTPDSGFLMCGITNGYGQGSNAIYVVKTKKDGTHEWSKALGGAAADLAYSIAADNSGNYFIAGTSSSGGNGGYDGFLMCIDVTGSILWEKFYGGNDWDFLYSVAVMPDQSLLLAGESYSFSSGGSDAWVLHLNSLGDTIWTRHFGNSGNDAFNNINVNSASIYLSGQVDSTDTNGKDGYIVKLDFAGNEIWQRRFNNQGQDKLNGSVFVPSGEIIIYGATVPFDSTNNDIWVEKIDTNGFTIWISNSGSPEDDFANKIIPIRNNDLVIIGQKNPSGLGNKSMFLSRYDSFGFQQDTQAMGGVNDEEGYSGVRTIENGIAFVGYSTSYGVGNKDAMLVYLRYDSTITTLTYNNQIFIETLSPIGVSELNSRSPITVFPNPASAYFEVKTNGIIRISKLQIFNFLGEEFSLKVYSEKFDISELSKGIYFLKIMMTDGSIYSSKLIKE